MMELFHVTRTPELPFILEKGLEPRIGPRAYLDGENTPAIYFFNSEEDAEDGVINWLNDSSYDDVQLTLLKVTLPEELMQKTKTVAFEVQCFENIPSKYITVINENF